ncbi:hypothetical protein TRIP_C90320 [Candidatus Zixiibacteriota bacterium]|nr:hypothetical protein TRIP_C90320 [candidate division Zixibacteria bacterium]
MQGRMTLKSGRDEDLESGTFNLIEAATILLNRRKTIFIAVALMAALSAGILLLMSNEYISTATILPSGNNDQMNELKALAGLGGIISPDDNSSELFPVILQSQEIRDAVLARPYTFADDGKNVSLTLKEYFGIENPDKLRRALLHATSIATDKKTGVISLGVETTYPALSQAILNEYLAQLDDFVQNKQRSGAKESARYLAGQLAQTKIDLEANENQLETYQNANRDWSGSGDPQILKAIAQFQREIEIKSQTYAFLYQQYESAKLDVQKDIPVVRILDKPTLPTLKSGPHRMITVIMVSLMTLMAMVFYVLLSEAIRRKSGGNNEVYGRFRTELSGAFPRTIRTINRLSKTGRVEVTADQNS